MDLALEGGSVTPDQPLGWPPQQPLGVVHPQGPNPFFFKKKILALGVGRPTSQGPRGSFGHRFGVAEATPVL
jgi:hypothetical protein